MSDFDDFDSPSVKTRNWPSTVWLIPLVTALVGGWLIVRTLTDQAPVATIQFQTAEGIVAGKTKIKYKNEDERQRPGPVSFRAGFRVTARGWTFGEFP